jgi:hypothetical protein
LTADLGDQEADGSVSSGFNARLDFGELARWGRNARVLGPEFRAQKLSLALLVLGVLADDANHATAMDHLALVANLLY